MKIILQIVLILFGFGSSAIACSCKGRRTVPEEVKHSDAVIVGKIVAKKIITLVDSAYLVKYKHDSVARNLPRARLAIAEYEMVVDKTYKGRVTEDTITVYTGVNDADCGIRFEIGKQYLVYADRAAYYADHKKSFKFPVGNNIFWTNTCTRTDVLDRNEIKEIEKVIK